MNRAFTGRVYGTSIASDGHHGKEDRTQDRPEDGGKARVGRHR